MSEIPAELISYLAVRDRERARGVDAALERRTPDELTLMKEAAVMAYVQGMQAGQGAPIPKNTAILRMVVGACLAMPDLYPAISAPETTPDAPTDEYGHKPDCPAGSQFLGDDPACHCWPPTPAAPTEETDHER